MNNFAVITARNEQDTIGAIVSRLVADGFRVIVVNDGSTDRTAAEAIHAGARVIQHAESKGIGPSLMEAWKAALDECADVVVQLDAGGSHDPAWAWFMAQAAEVERADIIIGSRFCKGGVYIGRKWRSYASRLAAFLLNFSAHTHFTDWTSGYRAFSRRALVKLMKRSYYQTMHAWQIEVLNHAREDGLSVEEFPITYTAGASSLKWRDVHAAIQEGLWILNR